MSGQRDVDTLLHGIGAAASRLAETDDHTRIRGIYAGVGTTAAVIVYSNGKTIAVNVSDITGRP